MPIIYPNNLDGVKIGLLVDADGQLITSPVALTALLAASFAHVPLFTGTVFYTDGTNGNDTNPGTTPTMAKQTIAGGLAVLAAGDALTIRAGDYDEDGLDMNLAGMEMWGEIGARIINTVGTECLTVSGDHCRVRGMDFEQAGAKGVVVTGDECVIEDCRADGTTIGFDIDGTKNNLLRCQDLDSTTTGYDISNSANTLLTCLSIAVGGASRGFYLSHANADENNLIDCHSLGNGTAGFEIVVGADYNKIAHSDSGGGDGPTIDNGLFNDWPGYIDELATERHEEVYPFPDGEGTAGDPVVINTDASDETHGAATTANYWGEPLVLIPLSTLTARWKWKGFNLYGTTTGKVIRGEAYKICTSVQSDKNGGNAWDEGETALTVDDGSLFEAGDLVWVFSTYKPNGEIVSVVSSVANVVTIAREASQFGAPNTGLRWNHTTNAAGTESMVLCKRGTTALYHGYEIDFSAGSARDFVQERFDEAKQMPPNCGVIVRSMNGSDSVNNTRFDMTIIYAD